MHRFYNDFYFILLIVKCYYFTIFWIIGKVQIITKGTPIFEKKIICFLGVIQKLLA